MAREKRVPVKFDDSLSRVQTLKTNRKLAYIKDMRVYIRDPGREPREIFHDERSCSSCPLAWHPDGKTIYHSYGQIYAIDVESAEHTCVTNFSGRGYGVYWTLDYLLGGRLLFFKLVKVHNSRPTFQVCEIKTDGSQFRVLLERRWVDGTYVGRVRAVQEQELFVVSTTHEERGHEFWSMDITDEALSCVASVPWQVSDFAPSPDGTKLAYHIDRWDSTYGSDGLVLVSIATGNTQTLLDFGLYPSWSPDGKTIAFMNGHYELWTIDVASRETRRWVWVDGRHFSMASPAGGYTMSPVWSPDGRYLCFSLTKVRRLRKLREPAATEHIEFVRQELASMGTDEETSKRVLEGTKRRLYWKLAHMVGIIDFEARTLWTEKDYWREVAWSPC